MNSALEKVDFDKFTLYKIQIDMKDSFGFGDIKEGQAAEDENGESLDPLPYVRRSIKYSYPFDNKKIINNINIEDEKEDEDGDLCRDINMDYYLLVETENIDDFPLQELHDVIEEEWRNSSPACEVTISLYEK